MLQKSSVRAIGIVKQKANKQTKQNFLRFALPTELSKEPMYGWGNKMCRLFLGGGNAITFDTLPQK